MIIVHYEVYVLESRGWMLHARFPRTERETAIAEAKELEQSLHFRVRVVRETYYTDDNSFEESEVYASDGASPLSPQQKAKQSGQSGGNNRPPPSPSAPSRTAAASSSGKNASATATARPTVRVTAVRPTSRKPPTADTAHARSFFSRLLAITALALATALLSIKITPNAILLLWQVGFTWTVTPEGYGRLLFAVFVTTFLMVAVPLSIRFLPRKTNLPKFGAPSFSLGGGGSSASANPERDRAIKKSLNKLAAQALAQEEKTPEDKPEDKDDIAPADPDLADLPEIRPGRDDEPLPEIRPDPEPEPMPRPAEAPQAVQPQKADAPTEQKNRTDEKEGKADQQAAAQESLQPTVVRFLDGAMNQAKALAPNMDALTKFALHLYLAGAVEALCDFRKQGDSVKSGLVALALERLGTRGDLARKFYDKIEEYLMEPRYLGMVQSGRDAMSDFMLGDEAGAHRVLRDAILEWGRKGDKKAQIVTVMFTDMVGSTDMTQARGDVAAQELVRRHNSIVRGALAHFGGKEIKHTGDGIMASFPTAAAAVEASVGIQRQVDQHNRRLPNQAVHLRIGLNAGEPIEEEDDLFGTTVQLAARVCAATNSDQILCTGVVKDLNVGKGAATFRSIGSKYMKGFKEAVPLFEVAWKA